MSVQADWRQAEQARLEQIRDGFGDSRRRQRGRFSARMDALRCDAPADIVLPPVELDGWDLLMRGADDLLGAQLAGLPDPATPFCPRPKGYVVHFDDEGVRIMVFGRRWGSLGVLGEHVIPFSQVDPASVEPGSTFARHKIARLIFTILAEGNGLYGSYERRLSGFANSLIAPNVPVRRHHQSG